MSAQEDYDFLSALADRLFGEEGDPDKRDKWLGDHMRQLGHKAKSVWEDSEEGESGGNSEGGYFGGGRQVRKIQPRKASARRSDWMYGS